MKSEILIKNFIKINQLTSTFPDLEIFECDQKIRFVSSSIQLNAFELYDNANYVYLSFFILNPKRVKKSTGLV